MPSLGLHLPGHSNSVTSITSTVVDGVHCVVILKISPSSRITYGKASPAATFNSERSIGQVHQPASFSSLLNYSFGFSERFAFDNSDLFGEVFLPRTAGDSGFEFLHNAYTANSPAVRVESSILAKSSQSGHIFQESSPSPTKEALPKEPTPSELAIAKFLCQQCDKTFNRICELK